MPESLERLLRLLLYGIAAFNKADYFLTLDALDRGFKEANPLLAPMVGTYQFHLVKLMLVPLLLIFLWQMRHRIGASLVKLAWIPFIGYLTLMLYYRAFVI